MIRCMNKKDDYDLRGLYRRQVKPIYQTIYCYLPYETPYKTWVTKIVLRTNIGSRANNFCFSFSVPNYS